MTKTNNLLHTARGPNPETEVVVLEHSITSMVTVDGCQTTDVSQLNEEWKGARDQYKHDRDQTKLEIQPEKEH